MSVGTVLVGSECMWQCNACESEVVRPAMRVEPVTSRRLPTFDRCPHCGQRALRPLPTFEEQHGDRGDPAGEPHAR